jgi:hypothetical protein
MPGRRICIVLFLYMIPMVPSPSITVTANGELLACSGFSLSETVHLGNFEFIADYLSGLSLFPGRGDEGATLMGSTRSGASIVLQAMIEDSTEVFLTTSSGEGSFGLPCSRSSSTGAPLAPTTTSPRKENALAIQAMMMFPYGWWHRGRKLASSLSGAMLITNDSGRKHVLGIPPPARGQCHGEACSPASRPPPWFSHTWHLGMSLCSKQRGS